jgi:hypothetical protein
MLRLKRRPGQCIWINKEVYIEVTGIQGSQVEISLVFPKQYEVLRGELVDQPPPPEASVPKAKRPLTTVLTALAAFCGLLWPVSAEVVTAPHYLKANTLICATPLDYYAAYRKIIDAPALTPQAVDDVSGARCAWTDRPYYARLEERKPDFYLVRVTVLDPSAELTYKQGWIGVSEIDVPG